jgi:uncharacterized protein (DUF433 family)
MIIMDVLEVVSMEGLPENLTTNEAAIAAGVSVAKINRVIDRKILPKRLYSTSEIRTVRRDGCLWIAFYFETAEWLTSAARVKAIRDGFVHCQTWSELRNCKVEESRTVQVHLSHIWEDVDRRLNQLKGAQEMVTEDPEILQGTPVIKGTRIPVRDVASLVDSGTGPDEILQIYPRLEKSQLELTSIYAKANPQRGRPKRRIFPKGIKVSISKKRLRDASVSPTCRLARDAQFQNE